MFISRSGEPGNEATSNELKAQVYSDIQSLYESAHLGFTLNGWLIQTNREASV